MNDDPPLELSIVAPMYNEEDNVERTVRLVQEGMERFEGQWEFVVVNDGSTDGSRDKVRELAGDLPVLKLCGYSTNRGRGCALRTGFAHARGRFVVSIDFDLSYDVSHVRRIHEALREDPDVDIVLGSAYMPGGDVVGVPWKRHLASRLGNVVLRRFLPEPVYTSTCVLRGYRREALAALPLTADGKELHLEILSKAGALGLRVKEIPARLESRKKGRTKAKLGRTTVSHLLFCLKEKPTLVLLGPAAVALALAAAAALRAALPGARGVTTAAGVVALFALGVAVLACISSVLAHQGMVARRERVRMASALKRIEETQLPPGRP